MRTALWLYLFMFVAFFDLHAQYPILSPFALSLGAAPSFIGLIMGVYSITHLPGNLIAGYGVDKYGSKFFIVFSLIVAGIILLFQSNVKDPWHLLYIRSISGFVLAFLSPACLSLLARIAKDRIQQSKLMAGNGLIHTLASVVSPAAGAILVAKIGFTTAFSVLGWILIITGFLAIFGVKEKQMLSQSAGKLPVLDHHGHGIPDEDANFPVGASVPWLFFLIPMALSCSQGILFFELPLMESARESILTSGVFFTLISLGALLSISFWFLNKVSPFIRTVCGSLSLAVVFFGLAIQWAIPLPVSLFLIGMAKGVIYPALAALLASITSSSRYGRVFSLLSISYSVGAFIGPMMAGQLRDHISSYFIAFFILMLALSLLPLRSFKAPVTT
ncbi:MFS transporter [Paenibacillus sp. CGMCC 1.16610]|uniref:MFS transporter n=1 Tax=Paenibacillus anseongense TaxID=2682845 RepID=A0ABW9U903_9BACL|nr:MULTISPECIES: MFS transporter [Paenibacillus]MBA2940543.1 MFS transporter [Paenibacillus sp. CGMCC 1.16610]MVQ35720.1 MFS transporter [Paenibacillus anseongense]